MWKNVQSTANIPSSTARIFLSPGQFTKNLPPLSSQVEGVCGAKLPAGDRETPARSALLRENGKVRETCLWQTEALNVTCAICHWEALNAGWSEMVRKQLTSLPQAYPTPVIIPQISRSPKSWGDCFSQTRNRAAEPMCLWFLHTEKVVL